MTSWWCEYAGLPDGVVPGVRLTSAGDRLASVIPMTHPAPGDTVLRGLTLPGFANAHSHAFHRALRGRTHDRGTFWTWRDAMYSWASRLGPESYYTLARAVFAEMVLAGYTVVGEFHYVHHRPDGAPYGDPNAMGEALLAAAGEAGLRITLLDSLYLAGGLEAAGPLPLATDQRRFSDGSVAAWAERRSLLTESTTARIGAAVHSVRAVPPSALHTVAGILGPDVPTHVHLSEQPAENAATLGRYGLTPTGLLSDAGLLRPSLTAVHATHLTPGDMALLGGAGAIVCLCPTTERDLADGIGPARVLFDGGVPLAVGSDSQAVVDPFEELRAIEMHERLATGERGHFSPEQLLAMGAATGYLSLGWPDGGRLASDALADFVTVSLTSVRTAGTYPDQALFAASAADVTSVVVGGDPVVHDGQHRLGDVGRLLAEAIT